MKYYKTLFAVNEKPTFEVPTTAENSRAAENSRTAESLAASSSPSSAAIQPGTKQKKGILSSLKKKFYKRWKLIKLIYSTIFKSEREREKKFSNFQVNERTLRMDNFYAENFLFFSFLRHPAKLKYFQFQLSKIK